MANGKLSLKIEKLKEKVTKIADKVFIGAGGHSIPLLQKSGVKQRTPRWFPNQWSILKMYKPRYY